MYELKSENWIQKNNIINIKNANLTIKEVNILKIYNEKQLLEEF